MTLEQNPLARATLESIRLAREHSKRERRIANTLQASMIDDPPPVALLDTAVLYVPGARGTRVGGDWHDVLALDGGRTVGVVGDVMGNGVEAATKMSRLQSALRAFVMRENRPARVLQEANEYVRRYLDGMATVCFILFDADKGEVLYATAGHPPPLLIDDEQTYFFPEGGGPPLGTTSMPEYEEWREPLKEGQTLLLYSDGLVERTGAGLELGLEALRRTLSGAARHAPEEICRNAFDEMWPMGTMPRDDIAVLALQRPKLEARELKLEMPATLETLSVLRYWLKAWLALNVACERSREELLIAAGEAATNVVMHAYDHRGGTLRISGSCDGEELALSFEDEGGWASEEEEELGGHGMKLMRAFSDSVDVASGEAGTQVTLRRSLASRAA